LAETVSVDVPKDPGDTLTLLELKPVIGPVGETVAVKLTCPLKPPIVPTVIVAEFDEPARTVSEEVLWTLDTRVKSWTLIVIFGDKREVVPFTPVTVKE
jgi:hypothetical protein